MLSPLTGGLLETAFGWRSIFYVITAASLAIAVAIAWALPETRRDRAEGSGGFRGDVGSLFTSRAFIGYVLCQVLASQIIFAFRRRRTLYRGHPDGPLQRRIRRLVCDNGLCLFDRQPVLRGASRRAISLEKLIWFGLALQLAGALLNLLWGVAGLNQAPAWLFGTQMLVMFANAFVMSNSAAGAISIRPEAAGTASGAMGFLQMGMARWSRNSVPISAATLQRPCRSISPSWFCRSLRLDDDFSDSPPRCDGQRGVDREGGGGRVGDVVRVQAQTRA